MDKFRIFLSSVSVINPSTLQNTKDQYIQNNKLVVLYGFKTCFLTLREEKITSVFSLSAQENI